MQNTITLADMAPVSIPRSLRIEACCNCGSRDLRRFHGCTHFGIAVDYEICGYCGLIFQNPTCTQEEWDRFYSGDYRKVYQGDETPDDGVRRLQEQRAAAVSGFLKPFLRGPASHLDIGCSMGVLLERVAADYGISEKFGVEPGTAYRRYCRDRGIRCYGSLEEISGLNRRFSLVTLSHVLEHINEPIPYMRHVAADLMEDESLIYIEVPNIRGGFGFELAHPLCFSPKTLADTLRAAGLEILFSKVHGGPKYPSPHATGYLSVIARRSDRPAAAAKAGLWYLSTSGIAFWRGRTMESWPRFIVRYLYRRWKYGALPKVRISGTDA